MSIQKLKLVEVLAAHGTDVPIGPISRNIVDLCLPSRLAISLTDIFSSRQKYILRLSSRLR